MSHPPKVGPTLDKEAALARTFVRLADSLVTGYDVHELLTDLADSCVELLDVDGSGILLVRNDRLEVAAISSSTVLDVEVFQVQSDIGPCHDCVRTGRPLSAADLTGDGRWPRFAEAALRRGLHAVHAIPLRLRDQTIGALNLFRCAPGDLPEPLLVTAKALADVATIAILQERRSQAAETVQAQLQDALDSRVVIEQAKGALAAQGGVTPDVAFHLLRDVARSRNQSLRTLAEQILSGETDHRDLLASRQGAGHRPS